MKPVLKLQIGADGIARQSGREVRDNLDENLVSRCF